MKKGWSLAESLQALREHTGIVIPTYVPPSVDASLSRQLLEDTVQACVQQVNDPKSICLSVDGENYGRGHCRRTGRQLWGQGLFYAGK